MSSELEEQLMEAGNMLLDPPRSVEDLLPLLDKAEYYLSRVEQSPNKLIEDALSPCIKALVADKLFRHSDTDVIVAVASCITELTRITAPEAPYTDEEMKEAFQLIVSSFEHLDDMSSRSYTKRTSILDTVAKVRSCVVMLDLECDALILEMFRHFLKAIRDYHPEKVFSSMETIMTLVIEESEDISPELLSPILDALRKDNEGVLPIAKKLGEQVLQNCSTKLKDFLGQALTSVGSCVDDYSEVVRIIYQDSIAENNMNDAAPTVDNEVECEAASPRSEVSNGVKQTAEDDFLADKVSEQPEIVPQGTRLRITGPSGKDNPDKSKTEKEAKMALNSKKSRRKRGRKWSSPKKSIKPSDDTTDGKGEPQRTLENGEDPSKSLPRSHQENQFAEAGLPLDGAKDDVARTSPKETAIESMDVSSPAKSEDLMKKEGLLKVYEEPSDSEVKEDAGYGKNSGAGAFNEDRTPIKVKISKKGSQTVDNSKTNSVNPSTEKVKASTVDKDGSSLKSLKVEDKKGPAKRKKHHEKDMSAPSGQDAEEKAISLSKTTKKSHRNEDQPCESPKDKGERKHNRDEDQLVETSKGKRNRTPAKEAYDAKEYGEDLVGSKVKVWWPKDKTFYEGVVDSFDAVKKRHKILYTDDDVEILNLKKERWEIIQDDSGPNEEQEVAEETPESMPLMELLGMRSNKKLSAKKGKGISSKKSKVVSPNADNKPSADSKSDANLETDSSRNTKNNNTPDIGRKLVGLARRMASTFVGSSVSKKEDNEFKKGKLKKDSESSAKGRTPRSVGRLRKVRSGGSDKVKSSSLKTKPKVSMEVDRDSGEPSDKVKSSSPKPKSEEGKEVTVDFGEDLSDKVKSSSLKLKSRESRQVGNDTGEEPSDKVKSSSSEARQKPELRESKQADKESDEEPSDKVKSSLLKPKPEESEDMDMDSGEEPSDMVSLKQKPKLEESEEVDKDSGEEPSDNLKSSLQEPKPKESEEEADKDSGREPSDMVKPNSSRPELEENKEADQDCGEETEKANASEKEKQPAESRKTPATGRKTGKKRRRVA